MPFAPRLRGRDYNGPRKFPSAARSRPRVYFFPVAEGSRHRRKCSRSREPRQRGCPRSPPVQEHFPAELEQPSRCARIITSPAAKQRAKHPRERRSVPTAPDHKLGADSRWPARYSRVTHHARSAPLARSRRLLPQSDRSAGDGLSRAKRSASADWASPASHCRPCSATARPSAASNNGPCERASSSSTTAGRRTMVWI